MTTNQTIDGVPRSTIELAIGGEGLAKAAAIHELRALLDAPAVSAPLSIPDECPHMIVFDDTDLEHMVFAGAGARDAALKTWDKISGSWNAHLFVRIERNSRDDRYPSATFVPAAQPQGVPVAWQRKSKIKDGSWFSLPDSDVEEAIRLGYEVRKLYAEQPAPVAVTLQRVLKAYEYAESHPHKYLRGTTNWCAALAHSLNTK